MTFRERLLEFICRYFRIPFEEYNSTLISIYNEKDLTHLPVSREKGEFYDLYNINNNFLLFFIDYSKSYSTQMILDPATRVFNRNVTSPLTLSTLHRHQYFELVFVIEGQLDLMIEKVHHRLYPHDACMINTNVRHVEEYTSDFAALYISLKSDFLSASGVFQNAGHSTGELLNFFRRNQSNTEDIDYLNFTSVFHDGTEQAHHIEELIFRLLYEMLLHEAGFAEISRQYINRLFTYFQDPTLYLCTNTHFQQVSSQTLFDQTLNYLYTHKRKITREELGRALNYNGNYISHVFQKHAGQTLAEYTRNICLTEAANLLLNTEMNISEIIQELGFENKTAFYNQFKKKYHMTPNEYRHSKAFFGC